MWNSSIYKVGCNEKFGQIRQSTKSAAMDNLGMYVEFVLLQNWLRGQILLNKYKTYKVGCDGELRNLVPSIIHTF